jgi:hypothetical protein
MKYVTSHIMGIYLQDLMLTAEPYALIPDTTLNELFEVQAGVNVPTNQYPTLQYLAIGNGGHKMQQAADGLSYPQLYTHQPTDCALISHIPFVMVPANADLTQQQRALYGMRVPMTVAGVNYIAYYLLKLNYDTVSPQILTNTVNNGVVSSAAWVPTSANLHPTPVVASNTGAVATNGQYVSMQEIIPVTLAASDIQNIQNVATILFGDPNLAIISEAALVAAYPMQVTQQVTGGGTLTYVEAIAATICTSLSCFYSLPSLNNNLTLNFDVGGAESLYVATSGTSGGN